MSLANITLSVANPTPAEVKRLLAMAKTINSNKAPGSNRAQTWEIKK